MAQNLNRSLFNVSTSHSIQDFYVKEPKVIEVLRLVIVSCGAFLGVLGSALVWVLAKGNTKRPSGNIYVRSLAAADIAILVVNFPIAVIKEQSPLHWPLGKEVCYVFYPLMEMFHGACIWSIVAIAVERYRGIVHTERQSLKSRRITVAVIWCGSFVLLVTPLLFLIRYSQNPYGIFCDLAWPSPVFHGVYNIMDALVLYVLPLGTISFTYLRITREINVSSLLHKKLSKSAYVRRREELQRVKQNTRTKKLLTPLVIVFSITMLPVNAFRIVIIFWNSFVYNKLFLIFYNICVIGVVMNSAADPIIYSIVTKDFISRLKTRLSRRSTSSEKMVSMATTLQREKRTDV